MDKFVIPYYYDYYTKEKIIFDSIITFVYQPYNYFYSYDRYNEDYNSRKIGVWSDSAKISNTYYIILDVLYSDKLEKVSQYMYDTLYKIGEKNQKRNICIDIDRIISPYVDEYVKRTHHIYLLKNNTTNDSLYCDGIDDFILVPYFVKQKDLYQNKTLIYDDKTNYIPREEYDPRFVVKYEDDYSNEKSTGKKVSIEPGSKWICSDVTLLKPTYKIYYILKNNKDEYVALKDLDGFIEESAYNKRESDKKIQYQQLIDKENQEIQLQKEKERKEIEKRKAECISLFGQ